MTALNVPSLPRHISDDPFNYTDDELAERKLCLKMMRELWPDVNPVHVEWVYDLCKRTPEAEVKALMERVDQTTTKHFACNDPRSPLYEQNNSTVQTSSSPDVPGDQSQ